MIRPPGSVYLVALFSRFETTCSRRVESPFTTMGSVESEIVRSWRSASMKGRAESTAWATIGVEVDQRLAKFDLPARDARDVKEVVQ